MKSVGWLFASVNNIQVHKIEHFHTLWTCPKKIAEEVSIQCIILTLILANMNFKLFHNWRECAYVIYSCQHNHFFVSSCHCIWYLVGWLITMISVEIIHYKVWVKFLKFTENKRAFLKQIICDRKIDSMRDFMSV